MAYCTNCGTQQSEESKFCHNCGTQIDEKQNLNTVESSLISEIKPKKIKVKKSIEKYFTSNKKLFLGNYIPIKPLVRILKMFEENEEKKIVSKLNHLLFYSISQESSIGGWDLGFSLGMFSNKIYLIISNGEPYWHFTVRGTRIKKQIFEIYDFDKKHLNSILRIQENKLIIMNGFNDNVSFTINGHNWDYTKFVEELINFINDLKNHNVNSIGESKLITENEFKENSKPNLGEKVNKGCGYLIVIFILFVVFVFIMASLFPTKQ